MRFIRSGATGRVGWLRREISLSIHNLGLKQGRAVRNSSGIGGQ